MDDEKKYAGGGVSACATCDGFFYKGKDVVVVGAGDTAAEYATYLAKLCNKVTMLVRKDHFRASKAMIHRVNNTPNIEVKFNHELIGIEGENSLVERAVVINNQTQETSKIDVHGIFIAIGHKPNTDIFKGQINLDENGYIKTVPGSTKTNLPGIFAAGDVQDHIYRQAITAATVSYTHLDVYKRQFQFLPLKFYPGLARHSIRRLRCFSGKTPSFHHH